MNGRNEVRVVRMKTFRNERCFAFNVLFLKEELLFANINRERVCFCFVLFFNVGGLNLMVLVLKPGYLSLLSWKKGEGNSETLRRKKAGLGGSVVPTSFLGPCYLGPKHQCLPPQPDYTQPVLSSLSHSFLLSKWHRKSHVP